MNSKAAFVEQPPTGLSEADLAGFRSVQRLAYDCAEAVAATLKPGMTERQVAQAMRQWLEQRGVDDWFHLPFAWFGDRTAFRGLISPHQFFPTNRRLEEGMPYILDCAPVMDGYVADIGFSGALGENALQARLIEDLAEHRALILAGVRAGKSFSVVYADVDRLLAVQGYTNCHRCYPFAVLAHRVERVEGPLAKLEVAGFGVRSIGALLQSVVVGRVEGWSPLWGPGEASNHAPAPGLWAVEPHVGLGGVGAKFEELLVVTENDAYWLDDHVPHARRPVGP